MRALGEALARLDQQLLQDVQTIASEHEERRTAILGELQGLASSIGMFQVGRPAAAAPQQIEATNGSYALAGDWREATKKIGDVIDEPASPTAAPARALFPHEKRRVLPSFELGERRRRTGSG
ncbi:MAG: hypothetical protein WDN31_21700 [Hyphomicrobium sp.]